ncbi:MAG: S41 family peptidase [Firmicutes bacterium]|nr:S41 family peptidase [Bacillota bacterium]
MTDKDEEIREVIVETNTGFNMIEVIIMIIISILFGILVGTVISNTRKSVGGVKVSRELQEFITTYNNVNENYYGKISEKELVNAAIEGMISKLDDPYSMYMDSKETEEFNETVDGSYVGIGATVGVKDNNNYIISLFEKSPAEKSGLKVGDIFVKVDGKDVKGMDLSKLTSLIKGKENTPVEVTVLRDGKEITKTITRSSIDLPSVTSKVITKNNKKIGYIYISSFAANSYKQFKSELLELEKDKIDSLVIDVRSNPGGHLNQVTKILELFMNKKKVLYQVESKGIKTKKYSTTKEKRDYNVVVLIDSASASASEILAAAFKESYDNATIVGMKSYGKGTVQKAYQLTGGASFKYTTEKWLTPKGNWIDKAGISPDVEVRLGEEYKNNPTDENDSQLQKALEILLKKES